jgi:hypothetical protein
VVKEWQPSFLTQSLVLTKRSFVNMYRDLGYYWLRFAIYIALCLCVGTIFYDVGHTFGSIQVTDRNQKFSFNYNFADIYVICVVVCINVWNSLLKTLHYCICRLVGPCSTSCLPSSPSWPSVASRLSSRT